METTDQRFSRLIEIMALLRSEQGCPWDREQDHKTLRQHLLEETYEVIETIDQERFGDLAEELGDVLLQVVFHAQIASEKDVFTIDDVIEHINAKLVRRHPHVFGDERVDTAAEQTERWEQTKVRKEGKKSAIDGIPTPLPALVRAYRMQNKAAAVGFDWGEIGPVWDKISEELDELKYEVDGGDKDKIEDELGDLLFSVVNVARFLDVNPEDALRRTIAKFDSRFRQVEQHFKNRSVSMTDATLEEMDAIWEQAKKAEKIRK